MIRIKDWNTAYWGYIRTALEPYPCHTKVNAFVGPSGGGKTTLMDAIRIALGDANFENNRTMDHYINPISNWAVVRVAFWNREEEGYPFETSGYRNGVVTVCVRLDKSNGKCEREYYLFDGDFNEMIELGRNPKLYKECLIQYTQYLQKLEMAGVTTAFRRLMIMRPEDIQNMVDLTPPNLFRRVFELKGQKVIQDKHDESQKKVNELVQQEMITSKELSLAEEKLNEYEEKKRLFLDNKRRKEEYAYLNTIHLKLSYWNKKNELAGQEEEQRKLELEKVNKNEEYKQKCVALNILEEDLNNENQNINNLSVTLKSVKERESELNNTYSTINFQYNQLLETVSELERIPEESMPGLKKLLDQKNNESDDLKLQLKVLKNEKEELNEKIEILNNNKNDLPKWVKEFKRILEHNNISYILTADCISIQKEYEAWLSAIEAFLGRDRYRIVIDEHFQLKAKKLQEEYEYRARISLPKKSNKTFNSTMIKNKYSTLRSALQIEHESKVGYYLERLNSVYLVSTVEEGHELQKEGYITLTKKGLLQDGDGAVFLKAYELVCGGFAREKYKKQIEKEYNILIKKIEEIEQEYGRIIIIVEELKRRYEKQRSREKLSELKNEILELENNTKVAKNDFEEAKKEYDALFVKLQDEHELVKNLTEEVAKEKAFISNLFDKLQEVTKSLNGYTGNIGKCRKELDDAINKLSEINCTEKQILNIEKEVIEDNIFIREDGIKWTEDILHEKLNDLKKDIDFFPVKYSDINEAIIAMVDPQISLVDQRKLELENVKNEREDWQERLAKSEYDLRVHIKETMNQYIEEFKEMADLLGAKVSGKFDQEGSHYLQWQLHIKIAFDGKELRPYFDPSFSKGQRAAVSIMLLLAAVNNHREGAKNSIMFLDEPTSRVDDYRANEIGLILQKTNIQYFITHQISASLQSVGWIDHAYVISKLRDGESFADDPIFESRRLAYESNYEDKD